MRADMRLAGRPAPRATALLGMMAVLAWPASAAAAEWTFTPRASLTQTWTDNVTLAPDGLEESDWITELTPGFSLSGDGPRIQAALNYDLQALWFADNSDFNDIYHQLNGNATAELAPERLFLDAFARYDQQNINTSGRAAYSNIFNTGNRTDAFVFGASPYYVGRWGRWGESLVRYQYQGVRFADTDATSTNIEDSDTNSVSASLGSPQAGRGFSWRASGSYARTEFEQAREFEFGRVGLDIGVPLGLRTRLTAGGGIESDVREDPSQGGLDAPFWSAGLEWSPDELQSLSVSVGNRYYGTSFAGSYSRRGSRGAVGVDYTESPTTSGGVLGDEGVFRPGFRPGGVPTLDTRVFLRKRLSGTASYEFVRSRLNARIYSDRRIFEDATGGEERAHGATVGYAWDLAPRTSLGATVDWEQRDFRGGAGTDDYGDFSVNVTRRITRTLSGTLRFGHFKRDSDVRDEYSANLATLSVEARF